MICHRSGGRVSTHVQREMVERPGLTKKLTPLAEKVGVLWGALQSLSAQPKMRKLQQVC